jgi:hypothetical protein
MSLHKLPSGLKQKRLSLKAHNFDYAALDCETQILIQQRTSEIKERLRNVTQAIWEIGQKLVDVRNCLNYGQFNSWLKTEFQWSRSTAYNYINVFETFGSCSNFGQLDIAASALYLLAAPSTPEEARKEALESARIGETVTYLKAKAIIRQYKKLNHTTSNQQSSTISVSPEPVQREPAFTTVPKRELPQKLEAVDFTESNDQVPPNVLQSHANSTDYDNGSQVNPPEQPISINTDDICILLPANVRYLTDEQIKVVWQAIALRIRSEVQAVYNLSDSELKQLITEPEPELQQ